MTNEVGPAPLGAGEQKALIRRLKEGIESGAFRYAEVAAALGCTEQSVRRWVWDGGHISLGYQDRLIRFLDLAKA